MMTQTKKKYAALIIYLLLFYAVWTVFELFIKEHIRSPLVNAGVIKTAVWVLPAVLLVRKFDNGVQVGLKEMFTAKVKWWRYLWVYAILAAWVLLGGFFQQGGLSFVLNADDLVMVLFVGVTEEMVFRGWLLNATVRDMPTWLAVSLNAVLFLAIHFPRWIQEGIFASIMGSVNFVGLLILSAIFSLSFLKSKNIWIPVTMHMFYDLMMVVFLPQVP